MLPVSGSPAWGSGGPPEPLVEGTDLFYLRSWRCERVAVGRVAVELGHHHALEPWHHWQPTLNYDPLVLLFWRIEFEFEFFPCDQIIGDGCIVSNQAICKIQVY